ncbi:hypothetical protein [Rhodococcus sp. H29-C3]|uniref:hypothetical protein n=1 Tax=Rhodococcus sp. H29-C3 TaxID=3046307 RepID=UPI0024BA5A16|nr:hypothetical protein [Rhodococcus sp. H29-C3]MDJ0363350.1 hypothetical protein [Rhodococcus sp. H29-C3]
MGKSQGRKNQNRPARQAGPPKRHRVPLPELPPRPPTASKNGGTVQITATAYEDSVLPVPLKFAPPLAHLASDPSGFNHQWQLLTYAFDFDNPRDFPSFMTALTAEELRSLRRFVTVAETVAPYTLVSHRGGFTMNIANGEATHETVVADDEVIVGFSVRFRQLHQSSAGDPDFSTVSNILEKHARTQTDSSTQERLDILAKWRKGRAKLMNRNLKNIVAHMVLAADNCPNPADHANYEGLIPTELISLFNYGELIHFGKHSAEYEELAEDDFSHDHKQHAFMVSMLGLIHLYFGYAELIRKAIA